MNSDEGPHILLVLYPAAKDPDTENMPMVWNPEDDLFGHLELFSTKDLSIHQITIYFEGVSRNWITGGQPSHPKVTLAEHKFLSQAQDILLSDVSQRDFSPEQFIFEAPFHFTISRMVASTNPASPEQCLQLPPSLELGALFIDETGNRFAQPSVAYYLRAAASVIMAGSNSLDSLETSLPVIIIPHTEELPPTETKDFPLEFKERETKVLRRSLVGSMLGTIKVSIQEPPALTYDIESARSHTEALLKLEFKSTSLSNTHKSLQGLSFTVYSLIRAKTFYSVKPFPRLPCRSLLGDYSETRLRNDILRLETQFVKEVSWGYRFEIGRPADEGPSDATVQTSHSEEMSVAGAAGKGNIISPQTATQNGRWISNWNIPIEVEGRLLPTFCSSLVARCYSLIIRVKVAGARQESFQLEVPLQVIYTSPGKAPSAIAEPVREGFLEHRRDSETSWFGEESEGVGNDPPRYYP